MSRRMYWVEVAHELVEGLAGDWSEPVQVKVTGYESLPPNDDSNVRLELIFRTVNIAEAKARGRKQAADELAAWRELAEVRAELNTCYRIGRHPTEKLLTRLDNAVKACRGYAAEQDTAP